MLFKTLSAAVYGIDASIIEVEVDVSGIRTTEDHFHTVGLPDAGVRGVRGALPIAIAARSNKIVNLIVPEANAREAAVVAGDSVYPMKSLMEVVGLLNGSNGIAPLASDPAAALSQAQQFTVDF